MIKPSFSHFELNLLNPAFDSPLVDVLNELEHLRRPRLEGSTPAPVFVELKTIFHTLESLGSARIEGNHTTLVDYVESKVDGRTRISDQLREIANIECAEDGGFASLAFEGLWQATIGLIQKPGFDNKTAIVSSPLHDIKPVC